MATNRIKGITIEIGGDTTPLEKALKGVNKTLQETQGDLKDINNLLKMNPKDVDLLKQKEEALNKAVNDTKAKLEQEKTALDQLKNSNGTGEVTREQELLERQIKETEQALDKAEGELKDFGTVGKQQAKAVADEMKKAAEKSAEKWGAISKSLEKVGKSLTKYVTGPLVAIGGASAKNFAETDKTMQLTNATMGNTEEQAKLLDQAMKDAAANSTFGMNDAATASLNFARAGLTAEQAAAAMAPAMNLAAGEGGDLDTVSAGLVATINGFHGSFEDAGKYADVFANACNNSALDVDGLSGAMSIAAPIFSAAGYTVQDAALYMGTMANAGIDANKAATSLKTGMARLVSPAKSGAEMMKKLGIEVTNSDGSMKDSITIQKELHDKFSELSESEQIAAASAIFGKNQMAPWLALINTAPEDVEALNTSLENQGTTTEMAQSMMSGFGGSLEKLKSSADVAANSFGEALAPKILAVSDAIQGAVDWFNSLDEEQKNTVANVALVLAAIGPVLLIASKIAGGIQLIISTVGAASAAITAAGGLIPAITAAAAAAAPFLIGGAIVVGIVTATILIVKNWDKIVAKAAEIREKIVAKWEEIKTNVVTAADNIKTWVTNKWTALKTGVINTVENIKSTVQTKWEAIKTSVSTTVENMKSAIITKWDSIKTTVTDKVEAIKDNIKTKFDTAKEKVLGVFEDIKTGIRDKIDDAKDFVDTAVEKIKSIMSFDWSLPDLKLPHIVVGSYIDVPVLGTIPDPATLSVEWYKKAYNNPVMFTQPTILQTPNGLKGFGDGSGGEIVLSESKLRALVGSGGSTYNINIYPTPGMNINQLADAVQDRLVALENQREAAGIA